MSPLPERPQQLYDALIGRGDVAIADLCKAIGQAPDQNRLGPYITRLNRRIASQGLRVKPGTLKGSYRMVSI